jgi:hypothetical protein
MWVTKGTKEKLLKIIESYKISELQEIRNIREIEYYLTRSDIMFFWQDNPNESGLSIPNLICLPQNQITDFLAWSITYLNQIKPFTSFCRVIDSDSLFFYLNKNKIFKRNNNIENICTGLIIGESITNYYTKSNYFSPIIAKTSFSYIFSRILLNQVTVNPTEEINIFSEKFRELFSHIDKTVIYDDLLKIWEYVLFINDDSNSYSLHFGKNYKNSKNNYFTDFIFQIRDFGKIKDNSIINYFRDIPFIEEIFFYTNSASRETRVSTFEKIIKRLLLDSDTNNFLNSFILAYIASQIAPGTLNYVRLLLPYVKVFKSILLWYGFFSGLYENSQIKKYGDGFGWKILKYLNEKIDIFERPKCDIALNELEILNEYNKTKLYKNFNTENKDYIKIEVLPTIDLIIDNKFISTEKDNILEMGNIVDLSEFDIISRNLKEILTRLQKIKGNSLKSQIRKNKK